MVPGKVPGLVLDMARLGSHELGGDDLVRALRPLVTGYRRWLTAAGHASGVRPGGGTVRSRRVAGSGPGAGRSRTGSSGRSNCCGPTGSRGRRSGSRTRRWRSSACAARWCGRGWPSPSIRRDRLCCGRKTCRRTGRGGRSSWRSCCCACRGSPTRRMRMRAGGSPILPTPRCSCCSSRPVAARPRRTWGWRRTRSRSGGCKVCWLWRGRRRDGTRGVAVLMRYTLRLLTAQQFQRAAALVCACEMLRRERVAAGDSRWGTTPFRIGLWVGSSVTPNTSRRRERADHREPRRRRGRRRRAAASGLPVVRFAAVDRAERADRPAAAAGARVLQRSRGGLRVLAAELPP